MANFDQQEIRRRMQRIEELVRRLEAPIGSEGASNLRDSSLELMRSLMELHGAGLERMMEIAFDSGAGVIIDRFAEDDLVAHLLLLYDLHPADFETRVRRALEDVRHHLRSHGGSVELLSLTNGVVRLRLQGNCHGCPSSAETLRQLIEQTIYEAAPDAQAIEVEGAVEGAGALAAASGFVQLQKTSGRS